MNRPTCAAALVAAIASGAVPAHAEQLRLLINGVPVTVQHARGEAAARLVERASQADARSPFESQWALRGEWRERGSLDDGRSHVLQVRGTGAATEAIHSSLDLHARPATPAPAPLWLPPGSVVTSHVEVLEPAPRSQHWVARSLWSAPALANWLRLSAAASGWKAEVAGEEELRLHRAGERLHVAIQRRDEAPRGAVAAFTRWATR